MHCSASEALGIIQDQMISALEREKYGHNDHFSMALFLQLRPYVHDGLP